MSECVCGRECRLFYIVGREGLCKEVTSNTPEGGKGVRQAAHWWHSIPGRGKGLHEECLVLLRKKEKARRRQVWPEQRGSEEEMRR